MSRPQQRVSAAPASRATLTLRPGDPAAFTVLDIFYSVAGLLAAGVAVPVGFVKSRGDAAARARVRGRLGFALPRAEGSGAVKRVMFHGVSVGEVKLVKPLLAEIIQLQSASRAPGAPPRIEPLVTSTTPAGLAEAERLYLQLTRSVFPIDFPTCAARFLSNTRPDSIVFLEWEMWPLFLQKTAKYKIPAAVVNARISEKTLRRYLWLPEFAARRLGAISLFCAQTDAVAARLARLGISDSRVIVTGNVKFDGLPDPRIARDPAIARFLNLQNGAPLLVAGSTHAPEEEILARIVARLRAGAFPQLKLCLVPRHIDRAAEILQKIRPILGEVELWSRVKASGEPARPGAAAILVDSIGELENLYRFATVAFVGGSLQNDRGGQNMLEPAALGVPVVHGPSTPHFTEAAAILQNAGASHVPADEAACERALLELFSDSGLREKTGSAGIAAIAPHRGAARRTVAALAERGFL